MLLALAVALCMLAPVSPPALAQPDETAQEREQQWREDRRERREERRERLRAEEKRRERVEERREQRERRWEQRRERLEPPDLDPLPSVPPDTGRSILDE